MQGSWGQKANGLVCEGGLLLEHGGERAKQQWWSGAQHKTPHHGLYPDKMALITSGCDAMRSLSIKWP